MVHYLPHHILISGDPLGPMLAKLETVRDPGTRRRMQTWIDEARKVDVYKPRRDPEAYERRVEILLNAITHSKVGTVLLTSLRRSIPLWIIPFQDNAKNAVTSQISSELSEGVKIRYSPETWAIGACKCARYYPGFNPTETLFHELVHASRFSNFGSAGMNKQPLEHMQDHEEFLAVMMTNVLRSEWRAKKFERDYLTSEFLDQPGLERFLGANPAYVKALASFATDPLVKQVARMPMAFNPFRDLGRPGAAGASR